MRKSPLHLANPRCILEAPTQPPPPHPLLSVLPLPSHDLFFQKNRFSMHNRLFFNYMQLFSQFGTLDSFCPTSLLTMKSKNQNYELEPSSPTRIETGRNHARPPPRAPDAPQRCDLVVRPHAPHCGQRHGLATRCSVRRQREKRQSVTST